MSKIFNNNKLVDGTYKELTWLYMEYNKVTMKRLGTYDNFSAHRKSAREHPPKEEGGE
jgi:hypothetical protein